MSDYYDFAIVGAGYGGLSAAALLAQKGKKVLVVEKESHAGGRSSYFEKNGFVWQNGQHSHRLEKQGIAAEVFDRLGDPLVFNDVGRSRALLFYKGKLFKRPEGLWDFLTTKMLSFHARLIFIRFYIYLLKQDPDDWYDKTLQEFYQSYSDDEDVENFLSFLGFTIMVPDIASASAGEVIDFIQRAKKARVKQGEPRGGAKQIIEKLIRAVEKYGGEIRYDETATEIIIENQAARGLVTDKASYKSGNVVYAAPIRDILSLIDPNRLDATLVDYCHNLKHSSGVVIDFVSREPLGEFSGGIIGIDVPFWAKFQTLIDSTVAPSDHHVCTWGILLEPGKNLDDHVISKAEDQLRSAASLCMPGFEEKVIRERKMVQPVINANMLIPSQSKPHRPTVEAKNIQNLYFLGDTTQGDGCSGDIAFSSAMKLADMIE